MFLFGAKALEQFIDRLVEWPQYCNHILQISHLQSTRPELVNFIERALARVSSGQLETSGTNNASIDQNQVSTLQENIEAYCLPEVPIYSIFSFPYFLHLATASFFFPGI